MTIELKIINPQDLTDEQLLDTAHYLLSLRGMKLAGFSKRKLNPMAMGLDPAVLNADATVVAPVPVPPPPALPAPVVEIPAPPPFNPFAGSPAPKAITPPTVEANAPVIGLGTPDTYLKSNSTNPPKLGQELDAAGLPWDNRIHSRTKAKTSDGKWRYRRGSTDAEINQIENDLRKIMAIPSAAPAPVAPVPPAPVVPAGIMPTPPPQFADALIPTSPEIDFPYFMDKVGHWVHTKKLTQVEVLELLKGHGIPNIPSLATRVDLIPQIIVELDKLIAGKGV